MVSRSWLGQAGEEITYDYCTSEISPLWTGFVCACGAPDCRGQLRWNDYTLPAVQAKYAGHFLQHVADRIAMDSSASVSEQPSIPSS